MDDDRTIQIIKDLIQDDPGKFEEIIKEAKEIVEIQDLTTLIHLYTCPIDHGADENLCVYHLEESFEHPWQQKDHVKWLKSTKLFVDQLMKYKLISSTKELNDMVSSINPTLRESHLLLLNKGSNPLIITIILLTKVLDKKELKKLKELI